MKKRKVRYFVADFETTVYDGQVNTEVWASAIVELFTTEVQIHNSISEHFEYMKNTHDNLVVYYHNLKFDGSFWLSYLMVDLGLQQAYQKSNDNIEWLKEKDMPSNSFKYSISSKGQWYNIIIKINDRIIELRDSLKLLPFSVARIGKSFGTQHKKLDMEYKGLRYAGCEITEKEKEYIRNDVLVVKEAIEIMFNNGHNDLTIGSCCLKEFKRTHGKEDYNMFFPNIYEEEIDKQAHKYENAGEWIRKSYRGGWCYLVKGKENKIFKKGTTADVNSLYPSMMSSESENRYPIGNPYFWVGNEIPSVAIAPNKYYFVRIKTRFYLKKDKLPFIQIKNTFMYKGNECLETSDIYDKNTKQYYKYYTDKDGTLHDSRVELTLTMTDFELLKEHYTLTDFEILDGAWFYSEIGLFDEYIEKYKKIKLVSKGALRELAKLFLNNLYGKMASSTESSFKLAYVKEDKTIGFVGVEENNKKPGFIPVGSAITSYARNFTIRTAQKNYHGKNNKGFIYADTDSIHCDLSADKIVGLQVDNNRFCCWKLESYWDKAIFARQKTYIEHITHEDGEEIENPYYSIKCAGMPTKSNKLLEQSLSNYEIKDTDNYTEEEKQFINKKLTLKDFKVGLKVMGSLKPKRIRGGILLVDGIYEMR